MAFRPAKIAALGRSQASRGIVRDQIQAIWSSLSGRVGSAQRSQPRHIQEQNDLYVSLLAQTHLQLKQKHDDLLPSSNSILDDSMGKKALIGKGCFETPRGFSF
jgi:hypothetical protein